LPSWFHVVPCRYTVALVVKYHISCSFFLHFPTFM
jgi:hypothetical protein